MLEIMLLVAIAAMIARDFLRDVKKAVEDATNTDNGNQLKG